MLTDDEHDELVEQIMLADLKLKQAQWFWESPRNLTIIIAAAVGAGIGIGNLIWAHREPPPPTPVTAPFTFPPGTVITIPPARP